MTTMSIREFAMENGFISINKTVNANRNGYHFLTFIDENNIAENVYLSKPLDIITKTGTAVTKEFLSDKIVAIVENAEGEARFKIAVKGETNRALIDDLL